MVLDETMAHACASKGLNGLTGEISVRFRQPVRVGTVVEAAGRILSERRRVVTTEAQLVAGGATIAEAEATFFVPPEPAASGPSE
jgi:acyl-coenzyme A thioesterase PaaI-like protein